MTQWTDERIPIWVPPLPGEALDSWIACYAARLRVSTSDFLTTLGLQGSRPARMANELTSGEADALSLATGLGRAELVAMTLQPFDGLAVTISCGQHRRLGQPPWWRRIGARSRYCPRCLDDTAGRWPLEWRLPWIYACRHHHVLLLEVCPACGNPPLAHSPSYRGRPATPGLCAHPIPAAEPGERTWSRCRHRLADTHGRRTRPRWTHPGRAAAPSRAAAHRAVRPRAGRPRAPRNLRSGLASPEGPGHGPRPGPRGRARRRT
ncbi:TniQ family protein [Streptomyces sp. NPDC005181]|uniref:TniQ family protein n=1 Tax=Streptomyces sp. NPDC005181 TaxID=3156869 RepID=UPI0033BF1476